jgi:hypothetical protein
MRNRFRINMNHSPEPLPLYLVRSYNAATGHVNGDVYLTAPSPDEALAVFERQGQDYTDARVYGPPGFNIPLIEFSDEHRNV